jgi:hypothetical protein
MNIITYNVITQEYILDKENFIRYGYLPLIKSQLKNEKKHEIIIKHNSSRGFESDISTHERKGIYFLYKKDILIYIGCTESCLYNRITRFIAGVNGTIRHDESHAGAEKYKKFFGQNLNDLFFKFLPIEDSNLVREKTHTVFDIEHELILDMKPLFNDETFHYYNFVKRQNVNDYILIDDVEIYRK